MNGGSALMLAGYAGLAHDDSREWTQVTLFGRLGWPTLVRRPHSRAHAFERILDVRRDDLELRVGEQPRDEAF